MTISKGAASISVNVRFDQGTAVIEKIFYLGGGRSTATLNAAPGTCFITHANTTGDVIVTQGANSCFIFVRGHVLISTAGTFKPCFRLSGAPGGAVNRVDGFFKIKNLGTTSYAGRDWS